VCKCVLPPGDNPIAVNKYINININIKYSVNKIKANYLLPKLDIVSIQIGANSLDSGDKKLNIKYNVHMLCSVNFVIMTLSVDK
jgi:hypothetical protein